MLQAMLHATLQAMLQDTQPTACRFSRISPRRLSPRSWASRTARKSANGAQYTSLAQPQETMPRSALPLCRRPE